jgi:hypothetical protein
MSLLSGYWLRPTQRDSGTLDDLGYSRSMQSESVSEDFDLSTDLVFGDQFGDLRGGQACLRLSQIFNEIASRIVPFCSPEPRNANLRTPNYAANQRF